MFDVPLGWLQLKREKLRFAVALLGVAFAVVLILMQLGFREALFVSSVRFHDALAADLVLLSPELTYLVAPQPFSQRRLYQARGVPDAHDHPATAVQHGRARCAGPDR